MDAFFPLIPRVRPELPLKRSLISPVRRYVKILGLDPRQSHPIGWQQQQKRPKSQSSSVVPAGGHELTPETEQHPDAQGHIDIYI